MKRKLWKGGEYMKTLKTILIIMGVLFLISIPFAMLPWSTMAALGSWFGVDFGPSDDFFVYAIRVIVFSAGLGGIFFMIMAWDLAKYKTLIQFTGAALLLLGVFTLVLITAVYQFTNPWFYFDPFFELVFGAAILSLARRIP